MRGMIRRDDDAGVATITIDRPSKLNALSAELVEALAEILDTLAEDRSIGAIVLTGAGRAFVAGADISGYQGNLDAFARYQWRSRAVFDALEQIPKVTVAAVNGYALGGGFELALCCDLIVASERATFGLPEGLLGLAPGGGGTQRLLRTAGRYRCAELMLFAGRWSANEAQAAGVVSETCPSDRLMERAVARARAAFRVAPESIPAIKRLLRTGLEQPLSCALTMEQETLLQLFGTNNAQEGIAAFLGKREPCFEGR